ncbi:MAG: glycosyltransferase family 4 protein [Candidatus Omnitrophica bacterium]|nr:glycosyltransferase family 4 protein [Candidatus Omnitrophota bacterium]
MNILYITNHLNIGGITSYCLTLASGLKRKGHSVYIASSGGSLIHEFIKEGIRYIPIPIKTKKEISPKIIMCEFSLSGIIKVNNIQIIHSHSRTTQVLATLLSRRAHIPHVYTCHGYFKRRLLRRLFPCWGDKTIAISQQVKEHLVHDFKVDEGRITVIHNGIDVEKFSSGSFGSWHQVKIDLGLGSGPVIGIVARLSDVKGHQYLIRAMLQVLREVPDAQLLICGEGKEKENLVKLVDELGVSKSVFFKPEAQGTQNMLSVMDVFVMPSLKEGLGLALMEAMAAGVPVVGSNIGGIRTLIQADVTGLLAEPADCDGLSRAIVALLKDNNKAQYLSDNARRFIREHFSKEQMIRETEEVYAQCLNTKR